MDVNVGTASLQQALEVDCIVHTSIELVGGAHIVDALKHVGTAKDVKCLTIRCWHDQPAVPKAVKLSDKIGKPQQPQLGYTVIHIDERPFGTSGTAVDALGADVPALDAAR